MKWGVAIFIGIVLFGTIVVFSATGAGSFKRMIKISGVYSVYRPDGYEVVCFLDADSKSGGLFCMPLSAAGGKK